MGSKAGQSKYLGKIFEGRWEVVATHHPNKRHNRWFELVNIYNHERMFLSEAIFYKVLKERVTLSFLRLRHIYKKELPL